MDYKRAPITRIGRWAVGRRAEQTLEWCGEILGGRLLELGPGRGVLAGVALRHGIVYDAADEDDAVLAGLPRGANRYHVHLPTRDTLGMKGRYDAIVCEAMIEHVETCADAVELLRWCGKLLRSGGRLVLRFPDVRFHRWQFWSDTPDHQWVTSLARVCRAVEWSGGFTIVRAGHSIDHFTGWRMWLIAGLVRLVPTRLLHRMTGRAAYELSTWSKLALKRPQGYVVAEAI